MQSHPAITTIATRRELVRSWATAARARFPHCPLFALIIDPADTAANAPFIAIPLSELDLPEPERFAFRHTPAELPAALKPFLLAHLIQAHDISRLLYLDTDRGPLSLPSQETGILLVARQTVPRPDDGEADELALLREGAYDSGSLALTDSPTARRFLAWWCERVAADCRRSPADGAWLDQKWLDLAPGLFADVTVLREPIAEPLPALPTQIEPPFSRFSNGVPIPDLARRLYREFDAEEADRFGDPFRVDGPDSFFAWLAQPGKDGLPPLIAAILDERPDLQQTYPAPLGRDAAPFLRWCLHYGTSEYRLEGSLLGWAWNELQVRESRMRGPRLARQVSAQRLVGVNLAGFFQSEKGLGEGVRALRRGFDAVGVPLALNNVTDPNSANLDEGEPFADDNSYAVNVLAVNAEQVDWFAQVRGIGWFVGRHNVGVWNWELPTLPPEWQSAFRYFDEIWVPSRFTLAAIAEKAPVPVRWLPYAVTVPDALPPGATRSSFGLPDGKFLFLTAFDYQSYLARKNPLGAIAAFRRAFGNRSDVGLVVKSVHADAAPAAVAEVRAAVAGQTNVYLLDAVLNRERMHALMRLCDGFVSLHRAEGFGLNIAEAMAMGKPVVATGWSSNMDFMTPGNSRAVRYELVEIAADHGPYRRGQIWAEPDLDHAAELLAKVADDRELAAQIGEQARRDIARENSPERVGAIQRHYVEELLRRPARQAEVIELARRQSTRFGRAWWAVTGGRFGMPPRALHRARLLLGLGGRR